MAARILAGDVVVFPAGPGLLHLPNGSVVTCPGKYAPAVKGKYRFTPYAARGRAVSFTAAARPADNVKVTTHELGEKPEPEPEAEADEKGTVE